MAQVIDFIAKKSERDMEREASIKAYEDGLKLAIASLMNPEYVKQVLERFNEGEL